MRAWTEMLRDAAWLAALGVIGIVGVWMLLATMPAR